MEKKLCTVTLVLMTKKKTLNLIVKCNYSICCINIHMYDKMCAFFFSRAPMTEILIVSDAYKSYSNSTDRKNQLSPILKLEGMERVVTDF